MQPASARVAAAVPDAITSATYVVAWIAPALLGVTAVRNLLVAIVVEFLVLHATALYGVGVRHLGMAVRQRAIVLAAVSLPYAIVAVWLALGLDMPWVVLSFLWLFTARFAFLLRRPAATAAQEMSRARRLWLVSLAAFVIGIVACNKLPLPALGLTPEFVATLSMSEHPDPSAQAPHISIAFGVAYFAVLALAKALLLGRGVAATPVRVETARS